jgi:hypothetical protein
MVVALSACWPSALCRQVDELLDVVKIAKSPLCVSHTYIYIYSGMYYATDAKSV